MFKGILAAPLSWMYGLAVNIRHKLFDWGIYRSEEFDIPIVCVGNLTVGGTGKTPHTEMLVRHFSREYNVAVLSRGYKRRTRGFVLATPDMSYLKIGDEPKQIKLKFPHIPVAVCEKRAEGIRKLPKLHPEINLVILDDAFQHRHVEAWVNVLLMDYHQPVYRDKFLPLGRLRDSVKQMDRAQFVVVTKCPDSVKPIDYRVVSNELHLYPYQSLYFSHFRPGEPVPLFPDMERCKPVPGQHVIGLAGIANPKSFFAGLGERFDVVKTMVYPDHHSYKVRDLERLKSALAVSPKNTLVMMTEKDAVKLTNRKKIPPSLQRKLYYIPVEVEFAEGSEGEFHRQIDQYVRTNQKYSILHPE